MLPRRSFIAASAAEPMKQTPTCQLYARIAPQPADWPVLLTRAGKLLRKDYDWSKDVGGRSRCPDALQHFLVAGAGVNRHTLLKHSQVKQSKNTKMEKSS